VVRQHSSFIKPLIFEQIKDFLPKKQPTQIFGKNLKKKNKFKILDKD